MSGGQSTEVVYLPVASPTEATKPAEGCASEMDGALSMNISDSPAYVLEWRNMTLKVGLRGKKQTDANALEAREKTILDGVDGFARPGELLVLMGPSGAGKTSLLDCLSGRNLLASGSVKVNGVPWNSRMKRLMTYVLQDDLFYETLTVREHLQFQAKLRLGGDTSSGEITRRVDDTMREFGLTKLAASQIGGVRVRGISGGERKRLSLAAEVLGDPAIFFVDEPTSGLDSFMAEAVVLQLQRIAHHGKTVLATIHQPSSELFALFDKLYLMVGGTVAYHGAASDADDYFAGLGYPCPARVNPADHFMRQLAVMDKENDLEGVQRVRAMTDAWREYSHTTVYQAAWPEAAPGLQVDAVESFAKVENDRRLRGIGQVVVIAQRNVVRLARDKLLFRVSIMQSLVTALIVGLVFLRLDLGSSGVQNFVGFFFFVAVSQTMIIANAQFGTVPLELVLVTREYQAGLYHVASWYTAKNASELPMQIILPVVFFVPVYFLVGVGHGAAVYGYQQIFVVLLQMAAVGFGYMVSCVCRRPDIAPVIGIVLLLPMLLLSGLLINSDDIPVYLIWLEFLSPIKYGFEGLMKIFWDEIESTCPSAATSCMETNGAQVLAKYSMTSRSALGDGLLLLALSAGFRLVGFLGLLWNVKGNRH